MESIHSDLVKIRKKSGLSITDIAKKTRLPEQVIEDIEKGSIFDKAQHQKTYIRSFVRAYAKSIGVKDDDAIRSLDAYELGTYTGFLYKKYLHVANAETEEKLDGEPNESQIEEGYEDGESSILKPGPTSTIGTEEFSRPDPSRAYNKTTPPPPQLDNIDWALVGTKLGNINSNVIMYLMAILLVGVVIIGGVYLYNDIIGTKETSSVATATTLPSSNAVAVDSTSIAELMGSGSVSAPPGIRPVPALPDTLYIVIHASIDKLEPVRILSDLSVRRSPYWIEHTEAMRFEFLSEIEIQGQIERMAFYINGHIIPDIESLDIGNRTVIISREFLASNPDWFTSEPPPLPNGMLEPSIIRDRPVF
jgi:transcriptional regulator with XRE-family HTH domain